MNHHELLFVNIKRYRKDEQFCDITFDVMGTKFPLHRMVISSASNYFEMMFTKRLVKPDQKEVALKGVTSAAFECCMDHIYEGVVDIQVDKLCETFHAARLFQIEKLMAQCVHKIRAIIDFDNCIEFYQFSLKEECQEIEEESKDVMLKNAEKILTDDSIISTMDEESLSMMLKSDKLNISDESVAFQALVKWTDMDKDRMEEFCALLKHVKLPIINRDFFTNVVYENEHIRKNCAKCKNYALCTLLHIADGKDHGLKKYQFVIRKGNSPDKIRHETDTITGDEIIENNILVMVVAPICESFKLFDVANDTLTDDVELVPFPVDTTCDALIHLNDRIYVMGENDGRRSFYCDYQRNKTWHKLPPMPNDHNNFRDYGSSVVCYNDKILVVGGSVRLKKILDKSGIKATNPVSCFCTQTNTWSNFPSLKEGRRGAATVMTDEHVYVIGGWNSGKYLSSVEMFDSSKWNRVPSLNTARYGHAAVYHNQKIFVAGGCVSGRSLGWNNFTSAETFVEGDSSWTNIASLNIGRSWASMFTHHGKLYVFGGRRNKSNLYEVWCEISKTWKLSNVKDDSIEECKVLLCNKAIKYK